MERLTIREENEIYVCCGKRVDITEKEIINMLAEKLAVYEDAEEQGRLVVLPEPTPDIDFMRIFNLVMADAEDRIIVMPCKAGNTIYRIVGNLIITKLKVMGVTSPKYRTVFENGERGPDLYDHDFGKTVFLTRVEAEKALEGMG